MKLGLIPINIGMDSLEKLIGLAQYAESLGFESLWTFEHFMVPVEYESKYPYSKDGKMGGGSVNSRCRSAATCFFCSAVT